MTIPKDIRRLAVAACILWVLIPLRVIADVVPVFQPIAEHLTGKSVDYLLMVTTLAAVGLTAYVMKLFIGYVIASKKEQQDRDDRHADALKELHATTRGDLIRAVESMDKLSDTIERRGVDQRMSTRGGSNG
jgi:hypothetical protein